MDYFNILEAHRLTGHSIFFHGSSGFGKTALCKAYCNKVTETKPEMELVVISASTLDPLSVIMPRPDTETGTVETFAFHWLDKACKATKDAPVLLLLDELNRVQDVAVLNMMTELITERKIDTHHLSPHTMIVATGNLKEEDIGVLEIPDAVQKRFTHISHVPGLPSIINNMRSDLAKEVLRMNSKIMKQPLANNELKLETVPRQLDDICDMASLKQLTLEPEELQLICSGRVGLEHGEVIHALIKDIMQGKKERIPNEVKPETFKKLSKFEEVKKLEVISVLQDPTQDPKNVADYLLFYATPETCRSLQQSKFTYKYEEVPCVDGEFIEIRKAKRNEKGELTGYQASGEKIMRAGLTWQYYALTAGKLTSGNSLKK